MSVLTIKLRRDLLRLWAQVLAIALVMAAGVSTLILGNGSYQSLSQTRTSYYEENRFADVFANITRAPKSLVPELTAIDGVAAVEPRIMKIALVNIEGMTQPASAMLVSLPNLQEPQLNRIHIRAGRLPDSQAGTEAVISEGFAKAHRLGIGSSLHVLLNGVLRKVQIVGVGLSPEFIYALGPGDLMPDDRRFGILWMPEKTLSAAYNLEGAFSNLLVKLLRGASEAAVIEQLDVKLARFGGQGAFGRGNQTSHAFLDAELKQLRALSRVLPPVFLLVAAFLVNMTLARLVALEREQIGLLKALGYSSWAVARHYVAFVAVIAVIGTMIGFVFGLLLGNGLTMMYARFFSFPYLVFSRDPEIYLIAAAVTIAAAVAGALKAVSDVAWLPPAVAMAPPAPARFRKLLRGKIEIGRHVRQSSVMTMRHLSHWPWRTASGVLGMALSVTVMVGSLWSFGAVDHMIDATFVRAERGDASINFEAAKPLSALHAVKHLPGVLRAEPYRSVAVKIRLKQVERRIALIGKSARNDLSRLLDAELRPVLMPEAGLVISSSLGRILRAGRGDVVEVELLEGDRRVLRLPVSAVVTGYLGLSAFMDIGGLNNLLNEGPMISGVTISIDGNATSKLFDILKSTPSANFIALQKVSMEKFRSTIAQNIFIMVSVYVSLATIIAFGVVYNFARISLSEQGRELASLRVLGFTRGEVSAVLLSELAVIVIVAQPLGWLLGYGIALAMQSAFSSELYSVPLVIGREVYAYASLIVMTAAGLSSLVIRRRVNRLDMISVLKTRE